MRRRILNHKNTGVLNFHYGMIIMKIIIGSFDAEEKIMNPLMFMNSVFLQIIEVGADESNFQITFKWNLSVLFNHF